MQDQHLNPHPVPRIRKGIPVSDLIPEAGAPVVTPAMIEAGVSVLYESGAIENPVLGNDRSLVRKIFAEMLAASRAFRR
jgi:hypothetical protein